MARAKKRRTTSQSRKHLGKKRRTASSKRTRTHFGRAIAPISNRDDQSHDDSSLGVADDDESWDGSSQQDESDSLEDDVDHPTATQSRMNSIQSSPSEQTESEHKLSHDEKWNFMFDLLVEFKSEHKHCNVPRKHLTWDGERLGNWVSRQRRLHENGTLSDDRIQKLEEVGFKWELQDWDVMFERLVAYKEEHGNCLVPQGHKDKKLGNWVHVQRMCYKKGDLEQHKIQPLEGIGFAWRVHRSWDEMFERLEKHKEKHGNCLVPRQHKNDPQLGWWVCNQRRGNTKVTDERKKRLDAIGFNWRRQAQVRRSNIASRKVVSDSSDADDVESEEDDDHNGLDDESEQNFDTGANDCTATETVTNHGSATETFKKVEQAEDKATGGVMDATMDCSDLEVEKKTTAASSVENSNERNLDTGKSEQAEECLNFFNTSELKNACGVHPKSMSPPIHWRTSLDKAKRYFELPKQEQELEVGKWHGYGRERQHSFRMQVPGFMLPKEHANVMGRDATQVNKSDAEIAETDMQTDGIASPLSVAAECGRESFGQSVSDSITAHASDVEELLENSPNDGISNDRRAKSMEEVAANSPVSSVKTDENSEQGNDHWDTSNIIVGETDSWAATAAIDAGDSAVSDTTRNTGDRQAPRNLSTSVLMKPSGGDALKDGADVNDGIAGFGSIAIGSGGQNDAALGIPIAESARNTRRYNIVFDWLKDAITNAELGPMDRKEYVRHFLTLGFDSAYMLLNMFVLDQENKLDLFLSEAHRRTLVEHITCLNYARKKGWRDNTGTLIESRDEDANMNRSIEADIINANTAAENGRYFVVGNWLESAIPDLCRYQLKEYVAKFVELGIQCDAALQKFNAKELGFLLYAHRMQLFKHQGYLIYRKIRPDL